MNASLDGKVLDVMIVDDHSLFRNGLKILLTTSGHFNVIAEAENGKDFLDLLPHFQPDIVLMDIDMPVLDGIEATKEALVKYPNLKVITLSMFGEEEYYYKMIEAGVKGFLLKNSDINEVKNALITVWQGGKYFSQELLYNVVKNIRTTHKEQELSEALSEREIEVLVQICNGLSNNEIADNLHISKRTVDKHRANLLDKTNSKNTAHLVMFAIKNKLIDI
ncbi:MAG TPA: response regulator transcription factor [Bacteroidales bacterium]|nr:response regulator transcription factor [Bacteroidales bacterium]